MYFPKMNILVYTCIYFLGNYVQVYTSIYEYICLAQYMTVYASIQRYMVAYAMSSLLCIQYILVYTSIYRYMQISSNLCPDCQDTCQYILAHTGTSEYILDSPVFDSPAVLPAAVDVTRAWWTFYDRELR